MATDPAQMAQFAQLLQQTVGGNTQSMQAAEQQLRAAETRPGIGLILLELLRGGGIADTARQAGAIYFKNYIRRQWPVESAGGGIAEQDRQAIKQHLLALMLQAPKPIQVQLAAGLEEISSQDYPELWQSLLPEMVQHLKTSQDIAVLKGTLQTADTVFKKFRSLARSEALLKDVKYTVLGFGPTHLQVFKAACPRVISGSLPPDQLVAHVELLNASVGAFYSLNVVDLPEFFEDNRAPYFEGFLELLKFQNAAVSGEGDRQGLLEQLKGSICKCFTLYSDRYQDEFTPYLIPCVTAVWTLLVGMDQQEKNDQLVAQGIHFLSSAARTHWQQSPFDDPNVLAGICEKVVFPNIVLRDSDAELFQDAPLEYVRRDMEGADQDTRRRSSIDLVKAIAKLNEAKVTEILVGYVKVLMEQLSHSPPAQAERVKEAIINLCIAIIIRGQTTRDGVTTMNQSVSMADFFTSLVVPELTSPDSLEQRPMLRAACLKFVTLFRTQLSAEQVGAVFPAICRHISSQDPVVHTYAAICIEKLVLVRDRNAQGQTAFRYNPTSLGQGLLQIINPILQIILSGKGIPMNEYLMRAISRIFSFMKQQGAEVGLTTLRTLSSVLMAVAANPTNPVFNHFVFESIATIVKVCVPLQPDAVEAALLPNLEEILTKNITDFLPYTFQLLGLLLDATPNVKPLYQNFFTVLLNADLWRVQANVPGLVRLLRAYFCKHTTFAPLLQQNFQHILERFQLILLNRKTDGSAFDLLNAIYSNLPFEYYQQYFKPLITVLLNRLQQSKSPKLQRDFVVSCSLFLHKSKNNALPQVLQEIQPGLLANLMRNIWLPALKVSLRLDERKVCTLALAQLLALDELKQQADVFTESCHVLVLLLGLSPSAPATVAEDGTDDEAPPDGGAGLEYEVSFSKLKNTDLPGAQAGLAPDVPDLRVAAKAALAPIGGAVAQIAQSNVNLQPLAAFLR